jgi:hypothetical protein
MRNTIIRASYKLGYAMGRVLRIFKPVSKKKVSKTKEITLTKQETLEFFLKHNREFADTHPELVFTDEEIRRFMSYCDK